MWYAKYSYKTSIHYIIFIIGFTCLFLTAAFQQDFFFFFMDKVVTSGLIIVQHQLPAGNCSFRCPTMAKLFLCSRLRTEKALSNRAVPRILNSRWGNSSLSWQSAHCGVKFKDWKICRRLVWSFRFSLTWAVQKQAQNPRVFFKSCCKNSRFFEQTGERSC